MNAKVGEPIVNINADAIEEILLNNIELAEELVKKEYGDNAKVGSITIDRKK